MSKRWYWVSLPYATYGIAVDSRGEVIDCPPIARWMNGKHWPTVREWVIGKGGTTKHLGVIE